MSQEHSQNPTIQPTAPTTPAQNTQEGQTGQSNFAIPEAYTSKDWASKIKSQDDLWKSMDNAQSLLGKRPTGIPYNDASDAEWDAFYKAAGRPDNPEYDFKDPEGVPEGFDTASYKKAAAEILHAAGLNSRQANKVYQMFLQSELGAYTQSKEVAATREKELDNEYDTLTKEHFGDNYDAAQKATFDAFERYSPQSLKAAFAEIADKPRALTAVVATINGMKNELDNLRKEYGAEGALSSGGQASSASIENQRDELATLRASKAARNFLDPEHKKTMERINELSSSVSRYYQK